MAMSAGGEKRKKSAPLLFDCGVPVEQCAASKNVVTNVNRVYKAHSDYDHARKCNKRYALANGLMPSKPQKIKANKGIAYLHPAIRG